MKFTLFRIVCAGFFIVAGWSYGSYTSDQPKTLDVAPTPSGVEPSMFNVLFAPLPAGIPDQYYPQNQVPVSSSSNSSIPIFAAINVTAIKGKAWLIDPVKNSINELRAGDKISENTITVTGPDSIAKISFSDGGILYLSPQTVVWINRYFFDFNKKIPISQTELNLFRGCIAGSKNQLLHESSYSIHTPVGTANVQGQIYLLDIGQPGELNFKKSKFDMIAEVLSQADGTTYSPSNKAIFAMQKGNANFIKSGQSTSMIVSQGNMIEITQTRLPRLFSITPEIAGRIKEMVEISIQSSKAVKTPGMMSASVKKEVSGKLIDTRQIPQNVTTRNLLSNNPNIAISNLDIGIGVSDMNRTQLNPRVFSLVNRDPATMYDLKGGQTAVVIDLGDFKNIKAIYFQSFGAIGSLDVAFASTLQGPSGGQWQLSASNSPFSPNMSTIVESRVSDAGSTGLKMDSIIGTGFKPVTTDSGFSPLEELKVNVSGNQTRYVLLVFNVAKPGPIGSFGIEVEKSTEPESEEDAVALSLIKSTDAATIAGVSSGSEHTVSYMTDDDYRTQYKFSPDDPTPVILLDLKNQGKIERASLLLSSGIQGNLEFYVLNENEIHQGVAAH
jgi:hypothetical protein